MSTSLEKRHVSLSCPSGCPGKAELSIDVNSGGGLPNGRTERFDTDIAAAAAALSFSASEPGMLERNLSALGFGGLYSFDTDNNDPERIGMTVASTQIGGEELTAVVLRPTQGAEWYSNFDVGYSAEHKGFGRAADCAEDRLYSALPACPYRDSRKFFVTGYSRGGAVANILARRLSDLFGTDRVGSYTFASPATALSGRKARYGNIFNIVRAEDFFTRVPPRGWGYARYGWDVILSCDVSAEYNRLTGGEYIGYTSPKAVDAVIAAVLRLAPNAHAYYRRRYTVGEKQLSLYEYMNSTASLLANELSPESADIIVDAVASEFADLSDFLTANADITELLCGAQGIPRCGVADSHSPAAYLAAMRMSFKDLF